MPLHSLHLTNSHEISDEMKVTSGIIKPKSLWYGVFKEFSQDFRWNENCDFKHQVCIYPYGFLVVIHGCHIYISLYWLPPATKLGQGYIFTGVCDSVNRGVCLSACWDTPRSRHPLEQTPPLPQSMLRDTVNARAVRILLECNLVNVCS